MGRGDQENFVWERQTKKVVNTCYNCRWRESRMIQVNCFGGANQKYHWRTYIIIIKSLLLEDYYGLRLYTTSSTVFAHSRKYNTELSRFNINYENVKMCSPQIQWIIINPFYQYINASCKRKISPFPGENMVPVAHVKGKC